MRLPGFDAEPIQWTREYWVTRRVLRAIWLLVLNVALLIMIITGVLIGQGRLEVHDFQLHRFAFEFGGLFTFLAIPISLFGIYQHLENNSKPHLQRHIVRILWMVPIYALDSWLALMLGVFCYMDKAMYFDTLRECYEAFTIYSFYCFTVEAIQDLKGVPIEQILQDKPPMHHWFPLRVRLPWYSSRALSWVELQLVQPWEMGTPFLRQCSWGILNYVILKPLMTVLTLLLQIWGVYGEGDFSFRKGYLYVMIINNCSQMWALYCLVVLYEATQEDLAPINPLAKFLCVKGVVFFTYWQQITLATLAYFHVFTLNHRWHCYNDMHDMINGIQDVLICFEMLGFSILHAYAFPSRDFRIAHEDSEQGDAARVRKGGVRIRDIFDVSDVYQQVRSHVQDTSNVMVGSSASVAAYTTAGMKKGLNRLGGNTLFPSSSDDDSPAIALLNCVSSPDDGYHTDELIPSDIQQASESVELSSSDSAPESRAPGQFK